MRCPTCRRDLLVVEWRRIELDHCPACRGTWFDAGELGLLLAGLGGDGDRGIEELLRLPPAESREKRVRCPRCDRRMLKVAVSGAPTPAGAPVVVDVCPAGDGFWFDRGEVGALAAALAARGTCAASRLAEHLGEMFR
jgi:Zn-finger nucleic acid-binding protein